jgi:hypothetical protein
VIEQAELEAAVATELGLRLLTPPVEIGAEIIATPSGSAVRTSQGRPYGRAIKPWLDQSLELARAGERVAVLVPARTETSWFQDICFRHGEVRFLRGRVRFEGERGGAPFPSAVVVFGPDVEAGRVLYWDRRRLF